MSYQHYRSGFYFKIISLSLALQLFRLMAVAVIPGDGPTPMTNTVYRENIHTVEFFRKGWEFILFICSRWL